MPCLHIGRPPPGHRTFKTQGRACSRSAAAVVSPGQLVESIGATQQGPDVLVSLFSIASAAGRLACGSVPDHFLQTRAHPQAGLARTANPKP